MGADRLIDSRLRLAAAVLALVSVGLLASLIPRTSFISQAADDIVDAVGPVWPEQSVEQVLGGDLGVVSEVRIWAAARFDRGEAPVVAALLQGPDRELVRQLNVKIQASKTLQPYELRFAPYQPQPGEPLILQFWVSPERSNYVIVGTSEPRPDRTGPTLNLSPTDQGPIVYELLWRGDGWRAALEGSAPDASRLVGGIVAAMLAVLLRPRIVRALRKSLRSAHAVALVGVGPIQGVLRRAWSRPETEGQHPKATAGGRAVYVFPWLIPAFAILHYLANNLVLIRAYEAIMISVVILAGVTVIFFALRFVLKNSSAAAVFTGLLGTAFFVYGHIFVDKDLPDDKWFLGLGAPIVLGIGMLLRGRTLLTPPIRRFLNLGSVVLLALPVGQLVLVVLSANFQQDQGNAAFNEFPGLDERISEARARNSPGELPDIYYIILDAYPRSGSPESFDNSAFIQEMENRGFYVDPYARSNYPRTQWSILTALNLNYYDLHDSSQLTAHDIYRTASNHALGRILKALGYTYVHVSSSWFITNTNPNADLVVSFGPHGRIVSGFASEDPCLAERVFNLSNVFTTGFLQTTMAKQFVPLDILSQGDPCIYYWKHPSWSLDWLEFMKESPSLDRPKFVFGHLLKPHHPPSFDRYGNISPDWDGWDDDHDPSVESAFYGQLLWLNDRLLEVVDAILAEYEDPPMIIIMGDHGVRDRTFLDPIATDIFAAYLLPGGDETIIYPGITPVNLFRSTLNYYFDLDFELLEDKVYRFWD